MRKFMILLLVVVAFVSVCGSSVFAGGSDFDFTSITLVGQPTQGSQHHVVISYAGELTPNDVLKNISAFQICFNAKCYEREPGAKDLMINTSKQGELDFSFGTKADPGKEINFSIRANKKGGGQTEVMGVKYVIAPKLVVAVE